MTILTIANQKGGVGKTTTAVTLAHGLAMTGQKTLLVEFDTQGHVAFALGVDKAPGLYRLIAEEEPISNVIVGESRSSIANCSTAINLRGCPILFWQPFLYQEKKELIKAYIPIEKEL